MKSWPIWALLTRMEPMTKDEPSCPLGHWPWLNKLFQQWSVPENTQQLAAQLRKAERASLLDPDTLGMIEGALQVSEMQVRDIMLPFAEMIVIEEDQQPKEFLPQIIESGCSRFPVIDEDREVQGIILAKDLLAHLADNSGSRFNLRDVMRQPVFVPESKRLNILLREFRHKRNHLAIVIDEYGNTAGLITIEDVIEQIVGDIDDEHDLEEEEFIKAHRGGRHSVKARTPINEFNSYFGSNLADNEFDTIGGLVLKAFGHMPRRGEHISLGPFEMTVLRADGRRVHLLRVIRNNNQNEETPSNEKTLDVQENQDAG